MPNPTGMVVIPTDAFDTLAEAITAAPPSHPAYELGKVISRAEVVQRGPTPAYNLPVTRSTEARDLARVFTNLADGKTGAEARTLSRIATRLRTREQALRLQERLIQKYKDWRDFPVQDGPAPSVPTPFLREMLAAGMSAEEVGAVVGMSRAGVYKRVKSYGKAGKG